MDEVSTCEITVKEGHHIKKGSRRACSTLAARHMWLLFRKGVQVEGFPKPGREENVPVRSKLAVVQSVGALWAETAWLGLVPLTGHSTRRNRKLWAKREKSEHMDIKSKLFSTLGMC